MTAITHSSGTFYGWRVVGAAFVLAVFGWGMGFYGPPVFLSVVREARGWPLALVSTAVTVHFLVGAVVGARLPALHRRFGASAVTKAGVALHRRRHPRLVHRNRAVAAVRRDGAERRGLGRHECRRHQCHRLPVVRAHAARRAGHGLQRRQHRRRDLLAALGGRHRHAGFPDGSGGDRPRRRPHDVGSGRPGVLAHTREDGIDARRRCSGHTDRRRSRRRRQGRCRERCFGGTANS